MKRTSKTDESLKALGAAVKRRRAALGLKQPEVVRLAGCSLDFIVDLERGRASRIDKVLAVLNVLGIGFLLTQMPSPFGVDEGLQ